MRKNTPQDLKAGTTHHTNSFGALTIIEYISARKIIVQFIATGYQTTAAGKEIRDGKVKDKLHPSVCNVGFIGDGEYRAKRNKVHTPQYRSWSSMIKRCYSSSAMIHRPNYFDCTVRKDWHNFQNFAKWYDENHPNDGKAYVLDKDIKVKGNRVYSPETCLFVSNAENVSASKRKRQD